MNNLQELMQIYQENNDVLTDKEIREAFGDSLKKLREYKQMTQGELAQEVLVSRQSISVYENGTITPTITNAYRIVAFFDLSVEDFIIYGLKAQKVFDEDYKDITEKYEFEHHDSEQL